MKKYFTIILAICITAMLVACSQDNSTTSAESVPVSESDIILAEEAEPAETPYICDDFAGISWDDGYEQLLNENVEIVKPGEFAGYYGIAHYIFNNEGKLATGVYYFNSNATVEWEEAAKIYVDIRNELISNYGKPTELNTIIDGQETISPNIYEVVEAGDTACLESWRDLVNSSEKNVSISLQIIDSGVITLTYSYR